MEGLQLDRAGIVIGAFLGTWLSTEGDVLRNYQSAILMAAVIIAWDILYRWFERFDTLGPKLGAFALAAFALWAAISAFVKHQVMTGSEAVIFAVILSLPFIYDGLMITIHILGRIFERYRDVPVPTGLSRRG